jgi:hypothetical protein
MDLSGDLATRFGHLTAGLGYAVGVQAKVGQQFIAGAVFDELVGNAQAEYAAGIDMGVAGGFQHRAAESARQNAFLHRDDKRRLGHCAKNGLRIQRFNESGVD